MSGFSLVVFISNAVGWIAYYVFSGGFFWDTETPEIRITTISTILVVSGVSLLVEVFNFENNNGRFTRALINNTILTSLLSGAVCFIYYGSISSFLERIWGMALIAAGAFIYYACFVLKNNTSLLYRIIGFLIVLFVLLMFTDKQVSQFGIGSGLMIGFLPCLANAIYYKYHKKRRQSK